MSQKSADALKTLLADYQVLYQKLRHYHWNITGKKFFELHAFFEEQYNAVALTIDEIAERLRFLKVVAPGSYAEFLELTSLSEDRTVPSEDVMVKNLYDDYSAMAEKLKSSIDVSEETGDKGTQILLEDFLTAGEKTAWMLRSYLE